MEEEKRDPGGEAEPSVNQTEGQAPATADQDLKKAFDDLKQANDALNERFLRLAADFDNYKKRIARDEENRVRFANERIILDVLEVADNIGRALKADDAHLREGLENIEKIFERILEKQDVTPIGSLGVEFDPAEHEAIAHVPSDSGEGIVIDEVARGYRMHGKIIRHAKVAVSKGKSEE
ncbi:MAG: nucleotide exchange factor GrpE [Methanoregulaceae archaeon]